MKRILLLMMAVTMMASANAQNKRMKTLKFDSNDIEDREVDAANASYDAKGRIVKVDYQENNDSWYLTVDYDKKVIGITKSGNTDSYSFETNDNGYITAMKDDESGKSYSLTYTDGKYLTSATYDCEYYIETCNYVWENGNISKETEQEKSKDDDKLTLTDDATLDIIYGSMENKANITLFDYPGMMSDYDFYILFANHLFGIQTKNLPAQAHVISTDYAGGIDKTEESSTLDFVMDNEGFATKATSSNGAVFEFSYETNSTTGIKGTRKDDTADDSYYNLNGERVNPHTKGLLIHKGTAIIN